MTHRCLPLTALLLAALLIAPVGAAQTLAPGQAAPMAPYTQAPPVGTQGASGESELAPGYTPIPTAQPQGGAPAGSAGLPPDAQDAARAERASPDRPPAPTVAPQPGGEINTDRSASGSGRPSPGAQEASGSTSAAPGSLAGLGSHITEGFEDGVMPPAGWTRIQTNPRETWKIMELGTPYAGAHAADVEYDSDLGDQNEVLMTPAFTASGAILRFASMGSIHWCRDTYDNCDLNVWLVIGEWGGSDDILVHTADEDWTATWSWSLSEVNLTPHLPSGTPVRVAFQYVGRDGAQVALDVIDITLLDCAVDSQFNGSAPNWVSYGGVWYAGAAYLWTNGLVGTSASAAPVGEFRNFDYQARVMRLGSNGNLANWLIIRGTPHPLQANNRWYSGYELQYSANGAYSVYKRVNGGSAIALQDWTSSPAINLGAAWNTLRVVAQGPSLRFYINDTLVWSGVDASLTRGRVGIGMYRSTTSTGDEFRVDWARLCTLPHLNYLPLVRR